MLEVSAEQRQRRVELLEHEI